MAAAISKIRNPASNVLDYSYPVTCAALSSHQSVIMLVFRLFVILALASAAEPQTCKPKSAGLLFKSENPEEGNCEEKGLGWKGRDLETQFPDDDEFFTKWNDIFLQPKCIGKIEVHTSDHACIICSSRIHFIYPTFIEVQLSSSRNMFTMYLLVWVV